LSLHSTVLPVVADWFWHLCRIPRNHCVSTYSIVWICKCMVCAFWTVWNPKWHVGSLSVNRL